MKNDNSIGVKLKNCFIQPIVVGDNDEIDKPLIVTKINTDKRLKPIYETNIIHNKYVNKHTNNDIVNKIWGLNHKAVKNVHTIRPINIGNQ